jgi:hypothetical protein
VGLSAWAFSVLPQRPAAKGQYEVLDVPSSLTQQSRGLRPRKIKLKLSHVKKSAGRSEQTDIYTKCYSRKLFLEALFVIEDPLRCRRRDQSLQISDNTHRYGISPIVITRQGNAA